MHNLFNTSVWGVRVWLGALFLFGGSVLVWQDITRITALEWALRGTGCVLLATLMLDLAVRYRIRDLYDTMALLAIYALLAGLLITPATAWQDFPRTLITRVLGGQGLTGIEMFGWILVFTNARDTRLKRLLLPVVAWNGFYWGIWIRWMPVFNPTFTPVTLVDALVIAALLFGIACTLGIAAQQGARHIRAKDFQLSLVGFLLLVVLLAMLLVVRLIAGELSGGIVVACGLLIGVSWAILWFRRTDKEPMLLEAHFPAVPLPIWWLLPVGGVFVGCALFAYVLPLVGTPQINQLWLMEIGFGAVGMLWYPLVAVTLAFRGLDRQMRTNQFL